MAQEPIPLRLRPLFNWGSIIVFALLHIGAVAALFMFNWKAFAVALFLYWFCTGLGISLGYHRLHTHRSFSVPKWMEYLFAVCGTLTLEGGPIFWVATHRLHHQKSDQPGDPHSPREGFWWAHLGWMLLGETRQERAELMSRYAPDLERDPFYRALNNWHVLPTILLSVLLYFIGGMPMFLWGVCVRVVFGHHATWLVNSATHTWGYRRFATRDDSKNTWWVALITFGEGWHNNHHAHPTSARHGLAWYEFDPSWIQLKLLKALGVAKAVKVAKLNPILAKQREAA